MIETRNSPGRSSGLAPLVDIRSKPGVLLRAPVEVELLVGARGVQEPIHAGNPWQHSGAPS